MGEQNIDPYDLKRFVAAQAPVYTTVLAELNSGEKRSHWIWYIFPQLRGLGSSETSRYYAISSLDEASAYLSHPLLGTRLEECSRIVLSIEGRTAHEIFGSPDDWKLRSCMTLFSMVPGAPDVFGRVLDKHFNGEKDARTIAGLGWFGNTEIG
ncbi:MAG TPA: DUF1810 domain-containing protein [Anaerolineaceae bacterium]|nr:DUF1810 domain-containing protein [Anaerolineaceae bacterium]